ncbi:MAG TPA: transcriptional regulator [Micromonosporaceae bacterium]|nr:transcriptional regulator [Micromonosporaceae bacterium]
MGTVTLSVTVTGPEETLKRLANSLGESSVAWDLEPTEVEPLSDVPITIDTKSHQILIDGKEIDTTKREYDLLLFFARHPGAAFTRTQIMRAVWGHENSGERTVDVHIRRLRIKLGLHQDHLATVRGYGYRMSIGIMAVL